jgi:histidine triad (HIT) family protein
MRYSLAENPTVFGKILRGEIPCRKVYEDDVVLAFHDIAPKAPVHVIILIKNHLTSIHYSDQISSTELGEFWKSIPKVAKSLNLEGYRLITNCGTEQEVPHLHIHLLGNPNGGTLPGF